jgi:hypothetical protein
MNLRLHSYHPLLQLPRTSDTSALGCDSHSLESLPTPWDSLFSYGLPVVGARKSVRKWQTTETVTFSFFFTRFLGDLSAQTTETVTFLFFFTRFSGDLSEHTTETVTFLFFFTRF